MESAPPQEQPPPPPPEPEPVKERSGLCANKNFLKAVMVLLNILFAFLGTICLITGIFIVLDRTIVASLLVKIPDIGINGDMEEAKDVATMLQQSAYVFAAVGLILFLVGFSGCYGAYKESRCLIAIYTLLILGILVMQISGAILSVVYKKQVNNYMRQFLNSTIANQYEGLKIKNGKLLQSVDPFSVTWDVTMMTLECCGNYNFTDFTKFANKWNRTYSFQGRSFIGKVPVSCCKLKNTNAAVHDLLHFHKYIINATECLVAAHPAYTNRAGCYDKFLVYIDKYTKFIAAAVVCVACVEIFGIFISCRLISAIRRELPR